MSNDIKNYDVQVTGDTGETYNYASFGQNALEAFENLFEHGHYVKSGPVTVIVKNISSGVAIKFEAFV